MVKRVLCILSAMNAGGAETFLMKIYRQLNKDKYQMDFCINEPDECYYEKEILQLGGRIYRITQKSKSVKLFKKQLSDVISREKYDYVLRITSNAMGFMDLMVAKKAGAKVCAVRSSNSSDGVGLKSKLAHLLGKLLYSKYIDVKIAPSDLSAKYTFGNRAVKKGNVIMLNNGVDLNVFRYNAECRDSVRNELGISDNAYVFGHIGRFSVQKNHMFLIDVFKEISKKAPNSRFVLIGCGELEEEIREKVKSVNLTDKVIFAGIRSDIPCVLSAMDAFVFPSLYEGMPNTVIEAQATGLPCVISDTITKEANITGLVSYLSLSLSAEDWAVKALSMAEAKRIDTKSMFVDNKYDIESVARNFEKAIFI